MEKNSNYFAKVSEKQFKTLENFSFEAENIFETIFNKHLKGQKKFYSNSDWLLRFLLINDYDKNKAIDQWKRWVVWHSTFRPFEISNYSKFVEKLNSTKEFFFYGKDKINRPCLYQIVKNHKDFEKNGITLEEIVNYLILLIENGIKLMRKNEVHQIVMIFDARKAERSQFIDNLNIHAAKKFLRIFRANYPFIVGKCYILGANWILRILLKIFGSIMGKNLLNLIQIIKSPEEIFNYFDINEISKDLDLQNVYDEKMELMNEENQQYADEMLTQYDPEND